MYSILICKMTLQQELLGHSWPGISQSIITLLAHLPASNKQHYTVNTKLPEV